MSSLAAPPALSFPPATPPRNVGAAGALLVSLVVHAALLAALPAGLALPQDRPQVLQVFMVAPAPATLPAAPPLPSPVQTRVAIPPAATTPRAVPKPSPQPRPTARPAPTPAAPPPPAPAIALPDRPDVALAPTSAPIPPAAAASVEASAPPAPAPARPDLRQLERYGDELSQRFASAQTYPRLAALRGWEGEVLLRLSITREGRLRSLAVLRSSGHEILDRHALALVEDSQPLPRPPAGFDERDLEITVPVRYRLGEG